MSTKGDIRKVVRSAIRRGWLDVGAGRKSAHFHLKWVDGTHLTASFTPSCRRAVKNFEADLRRVEKQTIDLAKE